MSIRIDGTNSAANPGITGADDDSGVRFGTDEVAIVTGGIDRVTVDSSGNLQFNSGYGSAATAYGCRAWVNFNGTGTPAIRESGNVSSITDRGTGQFTVNFTTSMPDANYSVVVTTGRSGGLGERFASLDDVSSGSFGMETGNASHTLFDNDLNTAAVFR